MANLSHEDAFARLVTALEPHLAGVVFIGGWAHRLYPYLEGIEKPKFEPLMTFDADIAMSKDHLGRDVRIDVLLKQAGFEENMMGEHRPPVTRYELGSSEGGFYAEFLTPLVGRDTRPDGSKIATEQVAGVVAKTLRYVEVLLINPWKVTLSKEKGFNVPHDIEINVVNPAAYLAQKLLVMAKRDVEKQAKDILYIHDTLQILGAHLEQVAEAWPGIRQAMSASWVKDLHQAAGAPFAATDLRIIRAAAIARTSGRPAPPAPERIGEVCRAGLSMVFL